MSEGGSCSLPELHLPGVAVVPAGCEGSCLLRRSMSFTRVCEEGSGDSSAHLALFKSAFSFCSHLVHPIGFLFFKSSPSCAFDSAPGLRQPGVSQAGGCGGLWGPCCGGRSRQVLPTAATSWGDTRRVSSPFPGPSHDFPLVFSRSTTRTRTTKAKAVSIPFQARALRRWLSCVVCRLWWVGRRGGGTGLWGDRARRGDRRVAPARSWVRHPAGNCCRNLTVGPGAWESGAKLFPWHCGVVPSCPPRSLVSPGRSSEAGDAGVPRDHCSPLSEPSWASQLSFLNQNVEGECAFSKGGAGPKI